MFGINTLLLRVGIVLALIAAFYYYKESIIKAAEKSVIEEVIKEDNTTYIETRKRIDKAITPSSSVESARDRLRERQERREKAE